MVEVIGFHLKKSLILLPSFPLQGQKQSVEIMNSIKNNKNISCYFHERQLSFSKAMVPQKSSLFQKGSNFMQIYTKEQRKYYSTEDSIAIWILRKMLKYKVLHIRRVFIFHLRDELKGDHFMLRLCHYIATC